jgi:hypothetical protein
MEVKMNLYKVRRGSITLNEFQYVVAETIKEAVLKIENLLETNVNGAVDIILSIELISNKLVN